MEDRQIKIAQVAFNIKTIGLPIKTAKTFLHKVILKSGCDVAGPQFIKENLKEIEETLDFLYENV